MVLKILFKINKNKLKVKAGAFLDNTVFNIIFLVIFFVIYTRI